MQEAQETQVQSLGQEDPLEEKMVTHSSILPWKILGTEEPGGQSPWGCKRARYDWATKHITQPVFKIVMKTRTRYKVPTPIEARNVEQHLQEEFTYWKYRW